MAFDALVLEEPIPTHGFPFQRPAESGEWRYCLELADPSAGAYAEWFDLTQFYAGDRYQRGADEYMGRYRAAVAQVQLQIDNVHADQEGISRDILAPWGQDTTELFGTNVELDAGLFMRFAIFRVDGGVTVEWSPIWTGRVETWGDAAYARGQVRIHNVTVVDLLSDLVNVNVFMDGSWSYLSEFFDDALTQADWLYGDDFYGDDLAGGPAYDDPTPVITVLDTTCDSMGLVWRTLRNGRLVIHPAPWDTTNVERYDNPLLDVYPDGIQFSQSPDFGEIDYITDDGQEPFGVTRTSLGIVNAIAATMPDGFGTILYPIDDPASKDRYGAKPIAITFNIPNEPVADELLAARAYASKQALPLRTSIDHEGFWSAMALVDHLDPIGVVHASHSGGSVVTADGTVRNITEERSFRAAGSLNWQTTIQIDVTATDVAAAILPVEDLLVIPDPAPLLGGPSSAQATWTNPTQPSVTPTDVEYRVLGKSLIWNPATYDGVGASGLSLGWLDAATTYTLQVRLIRQVDGVTTNASPVREFIFTTPAIIYPTPVPDGTDTDAEIPDMTGGDPECVVEVDLQEFDGTTWTTVMTFDEDDLVDNGDGTFSLETPIDNTFFDDDKVYRFRSREVCDGTPGDWIIGEVFDPPEDWTDPCTTPPALSDPPFDDAIVYVPQVCAPNIIREAVSGIEGVKGDAFAGFMVGLDDPADRALLAIEDPAWSTTPGGILAYGEAPQIAGKTQDKSISVKVNLADGADCVLFECAAMRITCVELTSGWRAAVVIYKVGSTVTLPTAAVLDLDTTYSILATYDYSTGDLKLYVDDVLDNSTSGAANVETIEALPIWRVGAPPESWITDCAVWDTVVAPTPPAPSKPSGSRCWLEAREIVGKSDGDTVSVWDDTSGNNLDASTSASSGVSLPVYKTGIVNGQPVLRFNGASSGLDIDVNLTSGMTAGELFVVFKLDADPPGAAAQAGGLVQIGGVAGAAKVAHTPFTDGNIYETFGNNVRHTVGNPSADMSSQFRCYNVRAASGAFSAHLDATSLFSTGTNTVAFNQYGRYIGHANGATDNRWLDGDIALIVLFPSVLSSGDRTAMQAYITYYYGITF